MIFYSPTVQKYILSGANVVATIRKSGYYYKGIYNVEDFLSEIKNLNKEIYERVLLIPVVPEKREDETSRGD